MRYLTVYRPLALWTNQTAHTHTHSRKSIMVVDIRINALHLWWWISRRYLCICGICGTHCVYILCAFNFNCSSWPMNANVDRIRARINPSYCRKFVVKSEWICFDAEPRTHALNETTDDNFTQLSGLLYKNVYIYVLCIYEKDLCGSTYLLYGLFLYSRLGRYIR